MTRLNDIYYAVVKTNGEFHNGIKGLYRTEGLAKGQKTRRVNQLKRNIALAELSLERQRAFSMSPVMGEVYIDRINIYQVALDDVLNWDIMPVKLTEL